MLRAGALYYTVILSLVIGLILSSIILLKYYFLLEFGHYRAHISLQQTAASGIQLLNSGSMEDIDNQEAKELLNFSEGSIDLKKSRWGVFGRLLSAPGNGSGKFSLLALSGAQYTPTEHKALYVAEGGEPLTLSGNTLIKGDVSVPKAGLERGSVGNKYYSRDQLLYGNTDVSEKSLPPVSEDFLGYVNDLAGFINIEQGILEDSIEVSFLEPTLHLSLSEPTHISGGIVRGNIMIHSHHPVVIHSGATIEDIIISAPVVEFRRGFTGNLQAFASERIIVKENCRLKYPSALVIIPQSKADSTEIIINRNSYISGGIISIGKARESAVLIEEKSIVEGLVYSNDPVDLKGAVHGSLYAKELVYRSTSGIYENYLHDATVDQSKLPLYYSMPYIFESNHKSIAKWLN